MHSGSSMELTSPILQEIAQQITCGNPLLGLAVANEYLLPSTPLHRALATQVRRRIDMGFPHSPPLVEELLRGTRCGELPHTLRAHLGKRITIMRERALPAPTIPSGRTRGGPRRAPGTRSLRRTRPPSLSQLRLSGDLSPRCARSSCSSIRRS